MKKTKSSKKVINTQEISTITLYNYHKNIALLSLIGGIIWIIYSFLQYKLLDFNDSINFYGIIKLIFNLIFLAVICAVIIMIILYSTNCKREKEDELYQENISKANKNMLCVLAFIGSIIVLVSVFLDEKSYTINSNFITGIAYLLFSAYHVMVLHYERSESFEDIDEE